MVEPDKTPDNGDFIEETASYEKRAVAFYDVLGWRSKIEEAGTDVKQVTELKNIVRMFSVLKSAYEKTNPFAVRHSTFSDNVVVSTENSQHSMFTLLIRLGLTQVGAAQIGFLIRGGVTVGDIVHDEHVVFGPGLNRAYHLESKVADKPMIVVDPICLEVFETGAKQLGDYLVEEDGILFLNPWTANFAGFYSILPKAPDSPALLPATPFSVVLYRLFAELKKPLAEKDANRIKWLRDRVSAGLTESLKTVV